MYSQDQLITATELAQFVIESGRVTGDTPDEWLESLTGEVEFECNDRGIDDCHEIAEAARKIYS